MNRPFTESDIEAVKRETDRAQSRAADPNSSVWVSANAGTGKTHVLTNRVLRLLLSGTEPARILCLTYTKAAAAEMSNRVFERLAGWVTVSDEALGKELSELTGVSPDARALATARTLFTSAIETPGGLKVQTIHAFAERLLQRFPLEAGVPPGFKILDDAKKRELVTRAIDATLEEATARPEKPLGEALKVAIRYATDASFDDLLTRAIEQHRWLAAARTFGASREGDAFAGAMKLVRAALGLAGNATEEMLELQRAEVLSDAQLIELVQYLAQGGKTDVKHSTWLAEALTQRDPPVRATLIGKYLLTDNGPRDKLMSKALGEARPDLLAILTRAQTAFADLTRDLRAFYAADATSALYRLAAAVLQRYSDAKAAAGALDFDDLITRTTNLLARSDSAAWVLYKLDGGLDHVLVDEAQDTSPEQWEIVRALAQEFFAGTGARPDVVRTLFAVGDEKQSIYSFQGAAPEQFHAMGAYFAEEARASAARFEAVPLNLSFRSVQAVLDAVDGVFADPARTPGLTAVAQDIRHIASRFGHGGRVEIWPVESPIEAELADPWSPLADLTERAPVNRLAERIAANIESWLRNKEVLASAGRPIRAGDILILVRKRHPFAVPMVAALKSRGIPVAGSDRIELTDLVAVKDLMALGDFLTLPEDDLALAVVLKSPLFSLNDDDLLAIAPQRKGSLWKALLAEASADPKYKGTAETLKRWRSRADFTPPFEFFSDLLDRDGGRQLFLNRLGPEAADGLDEFLELAISYDDSAPPSLTGFLSSLRQGGHEVKRDMEHSRDEVRVMTVHGAKGLEAPIVFLPDTCTTRTGDSPGVRLVKLETANRPSATPPPVVWSVKGTSKVRAIAEARAAEEARATAERNRLLYVAMTRARDRLYVAGFAGKHGPEKGCWYELIQGALAPNMVTVSETGENIRRLDRPQSAKPEKEKSGAQAVHAPVSLPPFALKRVMAEPQLTVPLAPSRLEPYAPDAEGEPVMQKPHVPGESFDRPSPITLAEGNRFLRGTLTHALLEHLPTLPAETHLHAAKAFVAARGGGLSDKARASIVNETLAILAHPDFKAIFSELSRAEVPIAATLPRPAGPGPSLKLSGQIDRLVVTGSEMLIVDYKTNRPPPSRPDAVAPAYLFQLAAYVLALGEIYPGKRVRAALLWTDGPRLMEIPGVTIQSYVRRLWDFDAASLEMP